VIAGRTLSGSFDAPAYGPVVFAYAYAAVVALGIAHFLLGIPIQLSDSFGNMLVLDGSWRDLIVREFTQRAYLRPFLWAELKLVYDLSGGDYFAWFRATHALQVALLLAMYVHLVRPRTWLDAAAIPLGVAVLIGMHTFPGTVGEAFPINTFLTILLCCFAAAILALSPPRWWNDVCAVVLFVVAALTVESGLLVWVIFVGGALVGGRGVSKPALGVLVALLAAYFYVRFAWLDVGAPGLNERSSGWGFGMLDPAELIARFGGNPIPFYIYNAVTSGLSVLVAEPRAGVFRLVAGFTRGGPEAYLLVNVLASTTATMLIGRFAWQRRRAWMSRLFERDDQLVLLFLMVLAANAIISYPYTKDVIMSPAGAFFAVAAYVGFRGMARDAAGVGSVRGAALVVVTLVLASTWAIRAAALHLQLRDAAFKTRTEWAYSDQSPEERGTADARRRARALRNRLMSDAVLRPTPPEIELPLANLFERQ
jgi:hypothetical protein